MISSKIHPSVTVAIPVLNEENHIERVISIFLSSNYPNLVEVLVADGGSTDRTREIVKQISENDTRVKLINNPDKYQSHGLNKMIEIAKGDVFLRADGHCVYSPDYLDVSIETLVNTNANNVGGSQRYIANNRVQAGISLAVKSFFGNGGAKYMNEEYKGYADTVFLGCFWTKELRKIGGFKESNHTNEDAEINIRIQEELGGKIYINPDIKIWYLPRDSFKSLFKQYLRYGRGRYLTNKMHSGNMPYRSKAPFLFVGFMILFLLLDQLFLDQLLGSHYVATAFLIVIVFESFRISFSKKKYFDKVIWKNSFETKPNLITRAMFTFCAFLTMHFAHFSGYGYQLIKNKILRKKGW